MRIRAVASGAEWKGKRMVAGAGAVGAAFLLSVAPSAEAQRGSGGTVQRVSVGPRGCAEVTAMPTVLAATPEGRSIVKLQRELEVVSQLAAKRGEQSAQLRGIVSVQKNVDSLMEVIVRHLGTGEGGASVVLRRDSLARGVHEVLVTRDRIESELRELQPRVAALASAAANREVRVAFRQLPTSGWVGMRVSGSFFRETTPAGPVTRYCDDYPVIEAVDPGSPAEKGGLQAGDTLLAFNNRDVLAQPIVHSEVFVPGQQLRVKVRRIGRTRDVPIVVAEPREDGHFEFRSPIATRWCTVGGCAGTGTPPDSLLVFGSTPLRAQSVFRGTLTPRSTIKGAPPVPAVAMFTRETGATMVGGAQVAIVSAELAQSLGVQEGLLVMRVLDGTPTADAGLKAGDVIREINGSAARDLAQIQRAFSSATRQARLAVASKGATRVVVVRW